MKSHIKNHSQVKLRGWLLSTKFKLQESLHWIHQKSGSSISTSSKALTTDSVTKTLGVILCLLLLYHYIPQFIKVCKTKQTIGT